MLNIFELFQAFQKGKELTNASVWKNRTLATNSLVAFLAVLAAIAKTAGFDLQIDQDTLTVIAAGIAALVPVINNIMHVLTSARVGLPPRGQPSDASGGANSP